MLATADLGCLATEGNADGPPVGGARSPRLVAVVASFAFLISACGARPPATPVSADSRSPSAASGGGSVAVTEGATQAGVASYYADSLAGHPTASGEPYDPSEFTAAHRTLPFGTVVEVARSDGRSVLVRINDRGPFGKKKRIIDLSRAAAQAIGLDRSGIATVTLRVVSVPKARGR